MYFHTYLSLFLVLDAGCFVVSRILPNFGYLHFYRQCRGFCRRHISWKIGRSENREEKDSVSRQARPLQLDTNNQNEVSFLSSWSKLILFLDIRSSDEQEALQAQKTWKKSIMLVWRAVANHK